MLFYFYIFIFLIYNYIRNDKIIIFPALQQINSMKNIKYENNKKKGRSYKIKIKLRFVVKIY